MPFEVKVQVRNVRAVRAQYDLLGRRMNAPFADKGTARAVMEVYADHATEQLGSKNNGQWPALKPRYAAWKGKVRPGRPMMVFDGDLSRAVTDVNNRKFKSQTANTKITLWPDVPYAARHQAGQKMPQRKIIDLRQQDAENVGRAILGGIMRGIHDIL